MPPRPASRGSVLPGRSGLLVTAPRIAQTRDGRPGADVGTALAVMLNAPAGTPAITRTRLSPSDPKST
jgi:hypothetical protein